MGKTLSEGQKLNKRQLHVNEFGGEWLMSLDFCLTYYSNYVHKQIFSVMSLNIARSQMMDKKLSVLHVLTSGGQWVARYSK